MYRLHNLNNNMSFQDNFTNILYLLVTFIKITHGDVCYGAEFAEDISPCPDFENNHLNCDTLKLGMVEGEEAEVGMNGNAIVLKDIVQGTEMGVEIWKVLDIGKEFLYHMDGDICENLNNKQAPWYPLVESMKIFECPIVTDTYNIKDMSISLNGSQDMMTHEMIGDYMLKLMMIKDMDQLSCYEIAVTVTENSC